MSTELSVFVPHIRGTKEMGQLFVSHSFTPHNHMVFYYSAVVFVKDRFSATRDVDTIKSPVSQD